MSPELSKKLRFHQDKLLNTGARSRSVLLRRIVKKSSLDLLRLTAGSAISEKVILAALKSKGNIRLISDFDNNEDAAINRNHMVYLYRTVKHIEDETGLREFYLGWPFVVGHLTKEDYVRAPLLLFPVEIHHKKDRATNSGWYLTLRNNEHPLINRALFATIAKKTNYRLSDDFQDQLEDLLISLNELKGEDDGNLIKTSLSRLADLLTKNGIPVQTNEDIESPRPLSEISNQQLEQMQEQKTHLVDYRIVGIFQQGSAAIYNDYTELFGKAEVGETNQGIIDNLLDVPSQDDIHARDPSDEVTEDIQLDSIPDEEFNAVLPSDASQDRILLISRKNECTVVRGPPGTGKSQLIVNMISDTLRRGKRVLLVCQKRAALDVVYKRLRDVGLDDYAVLLHNAQSDRPEMYSKLASLLENRESSIVSGLQDTSNQLSQTSNEIDKKISEILSLTKPLWQEYYSSRVGNETYGGITLHNLYSLIPAKYEPKLHIPHDLTSAFDYSSLKSFLDRIPALEPLSKKFDTSNHPWYTRKDFAVLGMKDKDQMRNLIDSSMAVIDAQKFIVCSDERQYDEYIGLIDNIAKQKDDFIKNLKNQSVSMLQYFQDVRSLDDISQTSLSTVQSVERFIQAPDELLSTITWSRDVQQLQIIKTRLVGFIGELGIFEKNRFNSLCSSIDRCLPSKDVIVIVAENAQNANLKKYIGGLYRQGPAESPPSTFGSNHSSYTGPLCCRVDLSSLRSAPSQIKSIVTSGFRDSGNSSYIKAIRTLIFKHIAQKAEAGDKGARKALGMDGFLAKMKHTSPYEKAFDIAENRISCDIDALNSFLKREFGEHMMKIIEYFLSDREDYHHNDIEISESIAEMFGLFTTMNEMLLGRKSIYILENITGDNLDTKITVQLISKCDTSKIIVLMDPDTYRSLEKNSDVLNALTSDRAVVIREQRVQKYIDVFGDLAILIDSYLDDCQPRKRILFDFLAKRGFPLPESETIDPLTITRQLQTGKELLTKLAALGEYLKEPFQYHDNTILTLRDRLQELRKGLEDFDLIQELDGQKAKLSSIQKQVLNFCAEKLANSDNWSEIIRNEFFYNWIVEIEDRYPDLKGSPFERYTHLRNQLSILVERKRALLAKGLILQMQYNALEIQTNLLSDSQATGYRYRSNRYYRTKKELNTFIHELSKKRKIKPVRKLVEEYSSIIFKVAPCWLASPEVVSEVFPLQRKLFDVIVVDEASQCAVERMLPALYRGDKIVIVGDDKQLRPFDLFRLKDDEKGFDDDMGEDDTLDSESLLVLAKRSYGENYLTWHYRSKHQELIDFSNHAFYNGYLRVAPSLRSKPDDPPIKWISCNGIWDNRINLEESIRVVDELLDIWQKSGKRYSIGIVTFNDEQRDAILNEIERRKQSDPEFESFYYENSGESEQLGEDDIKPTGKKTIPTASNSTPKKTEEQNEKLFVKNIENVQGDERDIIIFSIGYAPDKEGKLQQHFGTLNAEGGENRLNVAVTRARHEVRIVCSFNPEEMKETSRNPGPRLLKKYLIYAKAISENNKQLAESILEELNPGFIRKKKDIKDVVVTESIFEEQVYNALIKKGYKVETQVGYSGYRIDLAVCHPDDPTRYILAIECDGATFHTAKSVRERDIARQKFLEHMGWNVERIWSRNWWRNADRELHRIELRIDELRNGGTNKIKLG